MIRAMSSNDFRTSTYARIGRSYPRPLSTLAVADRSLPRRIAPHLRLAAAVIAFLSALGIVGWFLSR
jgi:hypothetical protein